MALSSEDLEFISRQLGSMSTIFTNDQLQDLATDASLESPDDLNAATLAYAYFSLANDAIFAVNYRQGETQSSDTAIYDRLMERFNYWKHKAGLPITLPLIRINPIRLHLIEIELEDESSV